MDELAREIASLRDAVVPAWTEARSERLCRGVGQLRRRRRGQRVLAATLMGCTVFGLVYWRGAPPAQFSAGSPSVATHGLQEPGLAPRLSAEPAQVEANSVPESLRLADGSEVRMLSTDAAVGVERNRPLQIALRLESGSARFDVIPNGRRQFVVRAGSVEVGVLGTVFDVERADGRVRVAVSRGKVRVRQISSANAMAIVKAGESAWFDDSDATLAVREANRNDASRSEANRNDANRDADEGKRVLPPSAAKARAAHARQTGNQGNRDEAPRAAWRSLSQSGDYEGAYRLLLQERSVDDDSGALLDAADAARLSGHPEAALQYLRKVLDRHRSSPVAPLAAFTLGRILLERLGQPSEAAEAFSMARTLAPQGSLAQDALAREVEAWSKAGHPDEAYQRARQYVASYPQGRRLHAVQLYGGLRAP